MSAHPVITSYRIDVFDFDQDIIDSRDIIAHLDEIQEAVDTLDEEIVEKDEEQAQTDNGQVYDVLNHEIRLLEREKEEIEQYRSWLDSELDEATGSPDWIRGEALIHEDYFEEYIKQLIHDCFEMPSDMKSGDWPYRHMYIRYDAAASEAKIDYIETEIAGETFFIRA